MENKSKLVPTGVKVIAYIFEGLSVIVFLFGVALLLEGNVSNKAGQLINNVKGEQITLGWPFAIVFIALAVFLFVTSFNLIKGRKWAWWALVILLIVNGLSSIVEGFRGISGIIIDLLILYYLTRDNVKNAYNIGKKGEK